MVFTESYFLQTTKRAGGNIYKALCNFEQGKTDYIKTLETVYIELLGFADNCNVENSRIFSVVNKLRGLLLETNVDILQRIFKRTCFDLISVLKELQYTDCFQ